MLLCMAIVTTGFNSVRASSTSCGGSWQQSVRHAIRDAESLCRRLELPQEWSRTAVDAHRDFPLFAPLEFVDRIRKKDPDDPLLRQILPIGEEQQQPPGFEIDPLQESAVAGARGLLQKYGSRALLVTTGSCAIHCRYCFRRHYPYAGGPRTLAQWQPALDLIRTDEEITEVLLSGGDPLMVVDDQLARLAAALAAIPHVRRLRIHTRLPVVIPKRVTSDLLKWLCETRLTPVMVIHANHAREIDSEVAAAAQRLVRAGVMTLNQSVLLRGVNDTVEALAELSERLIEIGVMPYYLHQLDRVVGAAHFEVERATGHMLISELRKRLPGYAVPRYVVEEPGRPHKTVLA